MIEEQHFAGNQETYIIEELGTTDEEGAEIVDPFEECIVYGGPRQKIRKLEEPSLSRKIPVKMKTLTSIHGSAVTVSPNTTDVARQTSVYRISDSEHLQSSKIDLRSNQ